MIRRKKVFKVLKLIKNIVLGLVIAFLTLVLILSIMARANGETPSLFGRSLYRVSSGSMKPELDIGDVILVEECDGNSVKNGDIVTYVATSGEMTGRLITHRVIKEPYKEGANTFVVTKGDANELSDSPINVNVIKGKLAFKLDFLKGFFDFFVTPWGLVALIFLILIAFANEIIIFIKALMGYGDTNEEESVAEIIERYQREEAEKAAKEKSVKESDKTE